MSTDVLAPCVAKSSATLMVASAMVTLTLTFTSVTLTFQTLGHGAPVRWPQYSAGASADAGRQPVGASGKTHLLVIFTLSPFGQRVLSFSVLPVCLPACLSVCLSPPMMSVLYSPQIFNTGLTVSPCLWPLKTQCCFIVNSLAPGRP